MSKELEALKLIKWKLEDEGILGKEYELCDIIEKELKEYEQYKTVEKELGIGLITLIKALKDGVYVNINYIDFGTTNNFLAPDNIDYFDVSLKQITTAIYFKDYGKTWALTKEELL